MQNFRPVFNWDAVRVVSSNRDLCINDGESKSEYLRDLGQPFFRESDIITKQIETGPGDMQISYYGNGIMKGNIEVTNNGDFISISKGGNLTFGQGQGLITRTGSGEVANYTFTGVGNVTEEGPMKPYT